MAQEPTVGRIVRFYLNDDFVVSPATIIATEDDIDPEVLRAQEPWTPEGAYIWDPKQQEMVRTSAPVPPCGGPDRVHLKVDGLVRTYRVYGAPRSNLPRAGHWMWPPRA